MLKRHFIFYKGRRTHRCWNVKYFVSTNGYSICHSADCPYLQSHCHNLGRRHRWSGNTEIMQMTETASFLWKKSSSEKAELLPRRRNYWSSTSKTPFHQNLGYTVLYYLKLFEGRVSHIITLKWPSASESIILNIYFTLPMSLRSYTHNNLAKGCIQLSLPYLEILLNEACQAQITGLFASPLCILSFHLHLPKGWFIWT